MKLTQVLYRQHIGRYLKKHWMIQGKKVPRETPVFKELEKRNIPVYDANEIAKEEHTIEKVEIIGFAPKPIQYDQTHPDWNDRRCLTYKDNNVLLEGFRQAQRLTKTVEIQQGLPERYIIKNTSKELDQRVKNIVLNSHIFDAEQVKLEKIKDTNRPAFNFPRVYGVSKERRMKLLVSKLVQLVESMSGPQLANVRFLVNDVQFKFPFDRDDERIQFDLHADTMIVANHPLKELVAGQTGEDVGFADLHPIKDTITLNSENIYKLENVYPLTKNINRRHLHTIIVHFNTENVGNIYGEEVTEEQFLGRSLLKTFTAAASYARQEYGENVRELPKPVVLQCVQTDGNVFHFGVLQLNTLELQSLNGTRNIWYQTPRMQMFNLCAYQDGKPVLDGYNSCIIKHLLSFYENV